MIPVHLKVVSILPSEASKNDKIVSEELLLLMIDTTSLKCECSCTICPNVENGCPNNGIFSRVGDAMASLASPCRSLMTYSSGQLIINLAQGHFGNIAFNGGPHLLRKIEASLG